MDVRKASSPAVVRSAEPSVARRADRPRRVSTIASEPPQGPMLAESAPLDCAAGETLAARANRPQCRRFSRVTGHPCHNRDSSPTRASRPTPGRQRPGSRGPALCRCPVPRGRTRVMSWRSLSRAEESRIGPNSRRHSSLAGSAARRSSLRSWIGWSATRPFCSPFVTPAPKSSVPTCRRDARTHLRVQDVDQRLHSHGHESPKKQTEITLAIPPLDAHLSAPINVLRRG